MIGALAKTLFGTVNDRILKGFEKQVVKINGLEAELSALSDAELASKTTEFKQQLASGKTLDDILPEAFAVVREASKRTLNMRHFDVQLIGGMVLHKGMIAEMKTGEGKTLVATAPVYLNALSGKGVHVVTVNDYLAKRDAEWMGQIYKFLGLTVGVIAGDLKEINRKAAYNSDILYITNSELGFDYLRDNLKFKRDSMSQRGFNFAIVDEVDSILIDEARTPLIISGPTEDNSELYIKVNKLIPKLTDDDFEIDLKSRHVQLTEKGINTIEDLLRSNNLLRAGGNMYDLENTGLVHHVGQALRAHKLFTPDVDYIVKDGKVIIIDEFTGRMQEGRRFSEGLHQALEAKENVPVQNENQTLASITYQNYFRMYSKLAGMTGTAMTEAQEFADIYGLTVVEIPTNISVKRVDEDDFIYRTAEEKYEAIAQAIADAYKRKQPVLVGTVSIEKSEMVSKLLKKKGIKHNVLNAKFHEQEAAIVAQAGRPSAVTIATNMAGRGTDIKLGGNPEMSQEKWDNEAERKVVLEAGGLFVLGTERHESRRIDNQLRGRSGRQGDPGLSRFYLSLEDDLMKIFGSERMDKMLGALGMKKGESITHRWVSGALETAQKKVEARNYEIRKNLLKFDNVMNDQRKVVYGQRLEIMDKADVSETINEFRKMAVEELIYSYIPENTMPDEWNIKGLDSAMRGMFGVDFGVSQMAEEEGIGEREILENLSAQVEAFMGLKERKIGAAIMRDIEKQVLLITLDQLWKEHLHNLDNIRQGIYLRAYGQKDPLNEYKHEAFRMFESMLTALAALVTERLAHVEVQQQGVDLLEQKQRDLKMQESHSFPEMGEQPMQETIRRAVNPEERKPSDPKTWGKVGRNEACPCGSGKKYKQCHGVLA